MASPTPNFGPHCRDHEAVTPLYERHAEAGPARAVDIRRSLPGGFGGAVRLGLGDVAWFAVGVLRQPGQALKRLFRGAAPVAHDGAFGHFGDEAIAHRRLSHRRAEHRGADRSLDLVARRSPQDLTSRTTL